MLLMEYLFHRGEKIPLIGFGTYRLDGSMKSEELRTLSYGIDEYGMSLIDTAEMYGDGISEKILSGIIRKYDRSRLFIVDKILPCNAEKGLYTECCKRSLERLGTDHIDLYLLHWKGNVDMQDMVDNMEQLAKSGMIRHWGVSNFDTHEMEALFACSNGPNCFCDQILYNLVDRGAEYDLIPWCIDHDVLTMAYSPLCNSHNSRIAVTSDEAVKRIAQKEQKTPESLMLSFVIRERKTVTVFKTSSILHLNNNMKNVFEPAGADDITELEKRYPPPAEKYPLKKI